MGTDFDYPGWQKGNQSIRIIGFIADDNNADKPAPNGVVFDQTIEVKPQSLSGRCVEVDRGAEGLYVNHPSAGNIQTCGSSFDHSAENRLPAVFPCKFKVKEPTVEEVSNWSHAAPNRGMFFCRDGTHIDTQTYDRTHCADYGGIAKTGMGM
jgi:hypothetical protein